MRLPPALVAAAIGAVGFGFLFAPKLHLAMKHAIGPRREIGLRTIFNILGPLTIPAGANVQVLGVYDGNLTNTLATVLKNLGSRAAMVVFGEGGFDELSIVGPTRISELKGGAVRDYVVQPDDFGLKRATPAEIAGGDAAKNVQIVHSIFAGEKGACRDMVVLNAAAALAISGKARDMPEGVRMAEELIDSGAAGKKLEEYITFSRKAA